MRVFGEGRACDFCGGKDTLICDWEYTPNLIAVECLDCGVRGPQCDFRTADTEEECEARALAAWDRMWAPKPPGPATRGLLMDIAAVARKVRHDSDYVYVGNEWETESRNLADDEIQAALRECGLSESA